MIICSRSCKKHYKQTEVEESWRSPSMCGWVSYLDPSHSELSQGSAHLGRCCLQILPTGDDFDQQRVIVGWNHSTLEGRGAVQTDTHALTATEHLDRDGKSEIGEVNHVTKEWLKLGCNWLISWRESLQIAMNDNLSPSVYTSVEHSNTYTYGFYCGE